MAQWSCDSWRAVAMRRTGGGLPCDVGTANQEQRQLPAASSATKRRDSSKARTHGTQYGAYRPHAAVLTTRVLMPALHIQ